MDRSNEIHEYFVPHSNGHQLHLPTTLEQRTSGRFGLTNFKTFRQSDHLQLSPPSDKYNSQLNDVCCFVLWANSGPND